MSETTDPLDTPLPCDVRIGHVTFRQGVPLREFVDTAQLWHGMAMDALAEAASLKDAAAMKDATHE